MNKVLKRTIKKFGNDAFELRGDCTKLRGVISPELWGDCTGLWGEISPELQGNCTGLRGDISDLRGDIDDAEITADERATGIDIERLVIADLS
jgi:hypothetical protein